MQFHHPHGFRQQVAEALTTELPEVWEDLIAAGAEPDSPGGNFRWIRSDDRVPLPTPHLRTNATSTDMLPGGRSSNSCAGHRREPGGVRRWVAPPTFARP
jgi:hypothetical protein